MNYVAHFDIPVAGRFAIEKTDKGKFDIWRGGCKIISGFSSFTDAQTEVCKTAKSYFAAERTKLKNALAKVEELIASSNKENETWLYPSILSAQ
jgi:hypothetical protein